MLAKYISIITSPFIITPIFGLWVIGIYSNNLKEFTIWGLSFIVLTILLPFLVILIKIKREKIKDLHIAVREQRAEPFLLAVIGSLLLAGVYKIINTPYELFALAIVLGINGLVFYLITKFWKISIHAATFFGSILIVSILINPYLFFLFLILPIIVWARVKRERHNLWQGLIACLVVTIITLSVFYLFNII